MKGELIAGLVWSAVGLFVAVAAYRLGIGSAGDPGPGLLAFLLGIVMIVLGGAEALRSATRIAREPAQDHGAGLRPWRMAATAGALFLYIAALVPVGFPLATFAFLIVLFLAFAELSWLRAAALSALLSGATYSVFKFALGVQLPAGLLG